MTRYVVKCICGAKTGSKPPEGDNLQQVECCLCGRMLEARKGYYLNAPPQQVEEEFDLLKVE